MNPKTATSMIELIGNTPLLRLDKITEGLDAEVWVKLEHLNPTGSIKDRVALRMIMDAEERGALKSGDTILESSTGNTGTALSLIGTLKGYKVVIFETTPGRMSDEKKSLMEGFGAEVRFTTPEIFKEYTGDVLDAGVSVPGRRICLALEKSSSDYYWARQFASMSSVEAQKDTGKEILTQMDGDVDGFVASIGTGGTLMGVGLALKEQLPDVKVVGAAPVRPKPMKPGQDFPNSEVEGGIITDMLKQDGLIDEIVEITDEEAIAMTLRLWREEGIFAGVSSGANVVAAINLAKKLGKGCKIATVMHDSGDRYLTSKQYVT